MWIFLVFFILQGINCYDPTFHRSLKDQCIKLCREEELPVHPIFHDDIKNIICRTGCRLFQIGFVGRLDVASAVKHCQIGCKQTFPSEPETNICYIGCDRIALLQNGMQPELVSSPQEQYGNDVVLGEPETDGVDTDFVYDPSIKSQLEIGFNIEYKIPKTHIRTMPIENEDQPTNIVGVKARDTGDWLDCASKNSGIPRWILLSTMLGAIVVAIWLTLAMEARKGCHDEECDDDMLVEIPDEKHMENFIIEKDSSLLHRDAFNIASQRDKIDVEYLPPPQYSEVNDMDNSEPPNYAQAVENQNKHENA